MSAPPGNRHAAPPAYRRLVASLPFQIVNSWDWQTRCGWQPSLWKLVMPRDTSFIKALEQRLKLVDTAPVLQQPCFDLGAARLPREVEYDTKQAAIGTDLLKECGTVDASLFSFTQAFLKMEGFPSNGSRDLDVISHLLKKWERHTRHRVGYIVPFQQREAFCFATRGLKETSIDVPSWFGRYEVHYGFHVETPPTASYRGSALMGSEQSPEWQIFLTECAALVYYELMYQARQGRLHFISTDLRGLIRNLGFRTIMFGRDDLAGQLETLVDEIDVMKWSEVSHKNWALPSHSCDTYVSITGNWVAFNADAWESQMEDDMYLIPDEWGAKAFDHQRGSLTGLIDRSAEEKRTTRPDPSSDESGVQTKYKLMELDVPAGEVVQQAPENQEEGPFRFPNEKAQRRLEGTLDQFMVLAGVKPLITEYGYPDGLTLDHVVEIVRLHLGTCANRGPLSGQGAGANGAGPSGSASVKVKGQALSRGISIHEQMDRDAERQPHAKKEATAAKEEAQPFPPTPAIAPKASVKPIASLSKRPGAASNRRLYVEVFNLF